jgi:outer membrane protein assembly factor BamB
VPMRVARAWTTALAPNPRGGWNFITQTYEHESNAPTEFVVLDLASGKQTVSEGPRGVYANSNYQVAEQLRAANGRIFFPQLYDQMAYYDPSDETVKQLGALPGGAGDKLVFRVVFGPDGKLYGGTQSAGLPTVFRLDPDTLRYQLLGKVGRDRNSYSYAYYLAVDPPWLYAAVGQAPWELAALHMTTGEHRILATRGEDGFMELEPRRDGITVKLISGLRTPRQVTEVMWCVDGKLLPYDPRGAISFKPRVVMPRANPITRPPELDVSELDPGGDGSGRVRWRADATAAWREVTFRVKYTSPVDIDSLVALPDGSLLGSAKQYHGFFRYDPRDRSTRRYRSLGISGGPRAVLDGVIYFAGYPNGVLYAYDPSKPWTATKDPRPDANPRFLGNFAAAGAHYAYFLEPAANHRLYYVGRRERTGIGAGIGYYDVAGKRFAGHHQNLTTLEPRGLVVLADPVTLVYSGTSNAATSAQLIVFDAELRELERQTVIPGMRDTGQLFPTASPRVIIGVSATDHVIYRHDVATGDVVGQQPLRGSVVATAQRSSDRSIWIVLDATLWRYDPATLAARRVRDLPGPVSGAGLLIWQGDRLFLATTSQLRELAIPGN